MIRNCNTYIFLEPGDEIDPTDEVWNRFHNTWESHGTGQVIHHYEKAMVPIRRKVNTVAAQVRTIDTLRDIK